MTPDFYPASSVSSLSTQINKAKHQLQNQQNLVRVRGAALGQTLHQQITNPALLFLAGSIGFITGEFAKHQAHQARNANYVDSVYPFFKTTLNIIKLMTSMRALLTKLLSAKTPPSSPVAASVEIA